MLRYSINCSLCLLLQMLWNPRVSAFSSGVAHACLDALTVCNLPCPDTDTSRRPWAELNNGVLFPCCPEGMDFVAPPVKSQNYLLNSSIWEYQPEEIFTLTLTVEDRDYKYIGLLLYAVKGDTEEKVGEWQLAPEENAKFWKPPLCNGKALMHSSAVSKHYVHTFQYKAPPRGTGSIRFRAIVKHGETNGGSFFWPAVHGGAMDDDLIIGEAPSPSPTANSISWTLSDRGGSCDEACEAKGIICDKPAMMFAMQSEHAVQFSDPSKFITCRQPIFSHNGESCDERPLTANTESFCWSRDDGACMYNEMNICSAPANDPYLRVCACASNVPTTSSLSTTSRRTMTSTGAVSSTTSMLNTDITTTHPPSTITETTSFFSPTLQTSRAASLKTTGGISSTSSALHTIMTSTAMVSSTPEPSFSTTITEPETSVTELVSTTAIATTGATTQALQTSQAGPSFTSSATSTLGTTGAGSSSTSGTSTAHAATATITTTLVTTSTLSDYFVTTEAMTTSSEDKETTTLKQSVTSNPRFSTAAEVVGSMKFSAGDLSKRWVESASIKTLAETLQMDESVIRVFANQSRRLGKEGHFRLLSSVWIVNFIVSVPIEQIAAVETKVIDIKSNQETLSEAMRQQLIEAGADASNAVVTIIDFDAVVQATPAIPSYRVPDGNIGLVDAGGRRSSSSSVFLLFASYCFVHQRLSMVGVAAALAIVISLVHN